MTFWNGQYYTRLSCIDYGKKLSVMSYTQNPNGQNGGEKTKTHTP